MFLESHGRFIGSGHAGILTDRGTNWFTFHYNDGEKRGTATLGLAQLRWSSDAWPVLILRGTKPPRGFRQTSRPDESVVCPPGVSPP